MDAGGFSKGYSNVSELQTEFLIKGFSLLNYDAVNLAIKDFANGGEFLKTLQKKYGINFVSSNIQYTDSGELFTQSALTLKLKPNSSVRPPFKHLNIVIFGVCDERPRLLHRNVAEPALESIDPIQTARNALNDIKGKSDLTVMLFNGRFNTMQSVVQAVPGIDIVIMGGEYYRVNSASSPSTVISSTPSLGKYFGTLTLELDANKRILSHNSTRISLDETIADHEELTRLVEDFESARRQMRR